jgi:hypothetical protein
MTKAKSGTDGCGFVEQGEVYEDIDSIITQQIKTHRD